MAGTALGVMGAAMVIGSWSRWFQLLNRVEVPRDRTLYLGLNGIGAALGIAAFLAGTGLLGGVLAGTAILGGLMFLGLWLQGAQAAVVPAVAVGQPVLDFTAPDEDGKPYDLATLRGKPFLLKFFRGHW